MKVALGKWPPGPWGSTGGQCHDFRTIHYRQALIEAADECNRLFMDWRKIREGNHPEVFVALERKLRISAGVK